MAESLSAGWIAVGDKIGAGRGMWTGFLLVNGMLGGSIDGGKWELQCLLVQVLPWKWKIPLSIFGRSSALLCRSPSLAKQFFMW